MKWSARGAAMVATTTDAKGGSNDTCSFIE